GSGIKMSHEDTVNINEEMEMSPKKGLEEVSLRESPPKNGKINLEKPKKLHTETFETVQDAMKAIDDYEEHTKTNFVVLEKKHFGNLGNSNFLNTVCHMLYGRKVDIA
ncbi:hypothetical protein GDO86_004025, partial [Hymenochirus boettgeri]